MGEPSPLRCLPDGSRSRLLSPGGLLVTAVPGEIVTLLGPCVAVTCWCEHSHVGAICHAMLPRPPSGAITPGAGRWRFASEAVPELLRRFTARGGRLEGARVKLFGGADLLGSNELPASQRIGSANVALVRELLAARGLSLAASDVGGRSGRKLVFDTATGAVRVKLLGRQPLAA